MTLAPTCADYDPTLTTTKVSDAPLLRAHASTTPQHTESPPDYRCHRSSPVSRLLGVLGYPTSHYEWEPCRFRPPVSNNGKSSLAKGKLSTRASHQFRHHFTQSTSVAMATANRTVPYALLWEFPAGPRTPPPLFCRKNGLHQLQITQNVRRTAREMWDYRASDWLVVMSLPCAAATLAASNGTAVYKYHRRRPQRENVSGRLSAKIPEGLKLRTELAPDLIPEEETSCETKGSVEMQRRLSSGDPSAR
ncbi:hypothetical protein Bbelb_111850 [Branchiostoma belcheri]|nr:hypothetical protein Bbelb_111820 [Branchiostoma belcheri]KAI8512085.1 hypothetical protein Bbelb_111850 [Branchiostoma belcheri]